MPSAAPAALIFGFVPCFTCVLDNVLSWGEAEIVIKQSGLVILMIHPLRAVSAVCGVIDIDVEVFLTSDSRVDG